MQIDELVPGLNLEDKNCEFKGIIKDGRKKDGQAEEIGWLKTIAAFANTEGGILYVGVEDKSHKILALEHSTADSVIRMIHHKIGEKISPSIDYDIDTIQVPGTIPARYVISVSVKVSRNLPVVIHEGGLLGIYVRNYGQTQIATPEQIRDLVLMSDHVPYDSPFTELSYDKKDFSILFKLAGEREADITDKQLISIGFMSEERKLSKGALLFRDDCNDLRTETVCSVWPELSKESSIVLAHQEYAGNLLEIISKSIQFVKNHSANGYRKEETSRVSYIAYPERSVTEGIVNAVGHRNYFMQGTQIEINVFRDRLEIVAPGALLGVRTLTKEKNISSIIPRRRNEVICGILEMCRYMEKKESGFDKIEEDYASFDDNHKPYISSNTQSFTLTMPDQTYSYGVISEQNDVIPAVYTESMTTGKNDVRILAFCYQSGRTVREIAEYLNIKPSTYFRQNTISRLVREGFLVETVGEKAAIYRANHNKVKEK